MRVLLVDDSKAARFAMRNLLEKQGLEVTMAETGEEALERIVDNPVDIVFMDQSMPGMGGIEATRRITSTEETAHIPVVLCTGNEGDKLELMAEEAGAIGVLTKPPKKEKLEAIFSSLGAAAPAKTEEPELEITEEVEEDMGKLMEVIEGLQQQVNQLDSSVEEKVTAALQASDEKLKPLKDTVDNIGNQLNQKIKEQIAMDAGNQRIQLETLRQQVESGLEDIQEREAQFQTGLKEEVLRATTSEVGNLLNAQISSLKDSNDSMQAEMADRLQKMEKTVSSLRTSLLTKAALIAVAAAAAAFAAAFFLLR